MTQATNEGLQELIAQLNSGAKDSKILRAVAADISKPTRRRREVNLSRINRFTKEGETIIVPGKVLGGGEINHKLTISAVKFSTQALEKLEKAGATIIPFSQITKETLAGKRVRIIG